MGKIYRILDANINRASEGLRVVEDVMRFLYADKSTPEELKKLRHQIRKTTNFLFIPFLNERDSVNDIGLEISKKMRLENHPSLFEMITANFKRVQEALRTIEENLRLIDKYELSKTYESFRFASYVLEKECFRVCHLEDKLEKLNTDLYGITAEQYSRGRTNIEVVQAMIAANIKVIQYREKDKKTSHKYHECLIIRELTQKAGVTFIVNDDIDIALLVKADGVHVGQDDLPIEEVRKLVGHDMIIGLSTHSPQQAQDAVKMGADYIGVGPIFKTYTKTDVCEPVGLEYLEYVAKNIDIPFVAIGGIKKDQILSVRAKGAKCIAMVTEIVGAGNIQQKIASIRQNYY